MVSQDSKTYAFLTTFLSIIGFVIAIIAWRDDKYVMYYAKQSLVVFVAAVIVSFINGILLFIPILGWIIMVGLNVLVFIIWLMSWLNALSGQKKETPVVGDFANKFKL